MPLSINVGLSRKASKDYQSTGYSINVTAELDQALLGRPDELQHNIADLYHQAEQALDRQAAAPQRSSAPVNGSGNGNGRNGQSNGGEARFVSATASQQRAIQAICRRRGTDPEYEAEQLIGVAFVDLSVRQASELIDSLKAGEREGSGRGGGR